MSSSDGRVVITKTNQGPVVNAVTWVFMIVMVLAVLTKVVNKYQRLRKLMLDDLLIVLAGIFAVCQTIAVSEQVASGLGKPWHQLDSSSQTAFEKSYYASQILYITALAIGKIGTCTFLTFLTPFDWVLSTTKIYVTAVVLGWFAFILTIAFQCRLPTPWTVTSTQCIDKSAFWVFFAVFDGITDLIICIMPAFIIWILNMSISRKTGIAIPFVCRGLSLPLIVLRVVYLVPSLTSTDPSLSSTKAAIITEIHVHVTVILACFPFIKAVIDSMQHGIINGDFAYSSRQSGEEPGSSVIMAKIKRPLAKMESVRAQQHMQMQQQHEKTVQRSVPSDQVRLAYKLSEGHSQVDAKGLASSSDTISHDEAHEDRITVKTTITVEYEDTK